ncbi:MAG: hypothetical protein GWM88_13805 [Pseudomonadales bacterium]|nr:hypothetical protein [Pseudomonadales bacterium]NIX09015.1 hypothetical protein [Pseudomonadales bacterium]
MADVRLDLEDAGREADSGPEAFTAPPRTAVTRFIPWMVAAAALVAAVMGFSGGPREATPAPATTRFHVDVEAPNLIGGAVPIAVSPDGSTLAYSAMSDAGSRIYLRRLDEFESEPLAGSENGDAPFFAPDGQWIGYFAGGRLMKQSLVGGRPQELAPVPHAPGGASWGPDGTIVFATAWARNGLHAVTEDGSETRVLTEPDLQAGELFHRWPQVLPDGDSILFTVSRDRSEDVAILSMSSGTWELLPEIRGRAHYVDSGHLLYGDGEALLAARFDLASRSVDGSPFPLLAGTTDISGGSGLRRDVDPGYLELLRAAHYLGGPEWIPGGYAVWRCQLDEAGDFAGRCAVGGRERPGYGHPGPAARKPADDRRRVQSAMDS